MAQKKTPTKKKTAVKKAAGKASSARKKTAAKKAAAKGLAARKKTAAKRPARRKVPLAPQSPRPEGPPENPRAHALARKMAHLLLDKKALDVVVLDVRGMTNYADYFVVASGESDRQVSAMAEHVLIQMKETESLRPLGTEGMDTGQWVLLDFGEVVAHLFFTETRAFYDLEGLWADAPRERVA